MMLPALTSVRLPLDEIIRVAIKMQVELINGSKLQEMDVRMPVAWPLGTPPLRVERRRKDTKASNPLAFPAGARVRESERSAVFTSKGLPKCLG